jgi:YidC/Oxa1 family membrane protein insertase
MADPKSDYSMEIRLLLALILMLAVLFGTPYFYRMIGAGGPASKTAGQTAETVPGKAAKPESKATESKAKTEAKKETQLPKPAPAVSPEALPVVSAQAEETTVIDTNVYRITFSNRGGVVKSWLLKKYSASSQKQELELVNTEAAPKTGWPMSLTYEKQKPSVDLNAELFAAKKTPDGLGVDFEFSNGRVTARKTFRFISDSYLSQVSSEVTENGAPIPHLLTWRGGFGDLAVPKAAVSHYALYYDITASKLVRNQAKVAKDQPVTYSGSYSFAGLSDTYFGAVFLPPGNGSTEMEIFSDQVTTPFNKEADAFVGAAVGGEGKNQFALFVGPKDLEILQQLNPKLTELVNFGFFGFLAKPLFLIVRWVNNTYIHSYGWSIILVTIFLNFALFPLKISSLKSMKKMQLIQPEVTAINQKYKSIGMRDPKKQQQNQEIMALYQKHGVNPLAGGCVPMLFQMPFLFAFYTVFQVAIEMRGANWLWVHDLSQPETLAIRILPITMIVSQFLMQKMTPTTGGDPTQQKVTQFMPLIFGFMFYSASSGLMLYWLTSNLIGIAQQWFFNKTSTAAAVAQSLQLNKKSGRK